MSKTPVIVGAGFSGLIAAHAWPRAEIYEANPAPVENHKAVLRFRETQISALTGIPFKKVVVRKGVWCDGEFQKPTIAHANMYSRKVLSRLANDRSIWNLDPVERYIAPEDFYFQLIEAVRDRVHWGAPYNLADNSLAPNAIPIISTIPMPTVIGILDEKEADLNEELKFEFSSIKVQRYRLKNCELYQTVYFPSEDTRLYRATITGDLMIAESVGETFNDAELLEEVFGLAYGDLEKITETKQKYGKIAAIDERRRRGLIRSLSERGIYSLGRFATWRNVLLDDLVHDIERIKQMMGSDEYSRRLIKD